MLLYMPLRSPMRVTHILIQAPNGCACIHRVEIVLALRGETSRCLPKREPRCCFTAAVQPTVVKLFVNKVISISDIEYVPPAKEVILDRDYTKADMEAGLMVPLSSKFSSCTSIAVSSLPGDPT